MRLFVAVELPDEVRAALARTQERLRREFRDGVSWVKPDNLHLTLKFLGELPDQRVPALVNALRAVPATGALRFVTDRVTIMPPRGPGRVIVVDLAGDIDGLASLAGAIDEACASVGFQKESRRFRPHLTLGRLRPPRRVPEEVFARPDPTPVEFRVNEFVLMHSQLNPKGSIYTRAAIFSLG